MIKKLSAISSLPFAILCFSAPSYAYNQDQSSLNGTWKFQSVSCSGGDTVSSTNKSIIDTISISMENGKGSMTLVVLGCTLFATCDYQYDGTNLTSSNSTLTFEKKCGLITGYKKSVDNRSIQAAINGDTLTVRSLAGSHSACPKGDMETDTLTR